MTCGTHATPKLSICTASQEEQRIVDSDQPEDAAQQQQTRTAAIVLTKEEEAAALARGKELEEAKAWLPDGYSQIFRSYVLGP